ncbi:trimeric intracellular cation channel family protein [Luteithermobacter gelatinilyticus]|uniref:trimeric intracellular cation channel family protein n=1 Tax=Luteithermobacter gelatinilyticus TaxID=2582913 RepID=UPI001106E0CD|nr:trimeric intracellular cation channel family protein [Luteithermobacter gelatinilyticus]|tara:strand:- start:15173 stop:15793 length:621 start_codon:yes stop_codon:yes gene_type:complete
MENLIYWMGLAGIGVFSISGALAALRQQLDPFGLIVIATVTAIGGGTLRDIILDLPVFWVIDPTSIYVILATAVITPFWARFLESRMKVLIWADAFGLALFAATGTQKAMTTGTSAVVAITMGVMSAAAGGAIRDILCNEIPLVLRKELYAVPAILGGSSFYIMTQAAIDPVLTLLVSCLITLMVRLVAVTYSLSLPALGKRPEHQ